MTPTLFVAGTDTGVGKTRVGVALCKSLRGRGMRVGVFKPAETGCPDDGPEDALALREASGCTADLDVICPYRLPEPLAPAVAAKRAGIEIDGARIERCLSRLRDTHDVVICEGAGGLLVPFYGDTLTLDWLGQMRLPVLLVGRLGLGTINHTLLSARALRDAGIELIGTILSETEPSSTVAESTNPEVLRGFPEVGWMGVLPNGKSPALEESWVERILAAAGHRPRV